MTHDYEVIVGNVGVVWRGTNGAQALREYGGWKAETQMRTGRAAGEDVTLMRDGEIWYEYQQDEEV